MNKETLNSQMGTAEARKQWQEALGFDDLNWLYFSSLYQAYRNPKNKEAIAIFEEEKKTSGKLIAFPTAIAPPELMQSLPWVDYRTAKQESKQYAAAAKSTLLWIKKMQAGSGTSMVRTAYLSQIKNLPESQVHIGSKGTDLYICVGNRSLSLAEAQILQSLYDAEQRRFGAIAFHDVVSSETEDAVKSLWKMRSFSHPEKTYEEIIESSPVLSHERRSFQAYQPTINESGELSLNRKAPGGHALFAVDALRAAYRKELRPDTGGLNLIASIGNGEDLSSSPDPVMVGWMVKGKIPIAMVTTEKTANDLKGGQIALVKRDDGFTFLTIIEAAQAKEAGQLGLFEKLGLEIRRDNQIAFFNTNMALFNYDVLSPKITKLVEEIGEDAFFQIIAPDLIANWKEQKDSDGKTRKYLQLEGAMGSTLLNLDRYWRERFQEPLVHLINVDKAHRTDFFSPVKTPFDFFMQFYSDRFRLDTKSMRLINERPGELPSATLAGAYYADVKNVLEAFRGTSVRELDSLLIEGEVILAGLKLSGKISIKNQSGKRVSLSENAACRSLRNAQVVIDKEAKIHVTSF